MRFLFVTFLLMAASGWISKIWIVDYPNVLANDFFAGWFDPRVAHNVSVLWVDESDYLDYFGAQSPLAPAELNDAVCAIEFNKPAVVVVDFETSSPGYEGLPVSKVFRNIVWARPIHSITEYDSTRKRHVERYVVGKVLGEASGDADFGLAATDESPDGAVREFSRSIEVERGKHFPTLHWRAVQKALDKNSPRPGESRLLAQGVSRSSSLRTNYFFSPVWLRDLAAGKNRILSDDGRAACAKGEAPAGYVANSALVNRVVVFGGRYALYDYHRTPLGQRWGAEILATGIESDLTPAGRFLRPWPTALQTASKLAIAVLVAWIFWRLHPAAAAPVVLIAAGLIAAFGNILAFFWGGYELALAPFLVGLAIEHMVALTEKAQHYSRHADERREPSPGSTGNSEGAHLPTG